MTDVTQPQQPQGEPLAQDERILSTIGYISILCFLPLAFKPKNAYCQFHGKQALIMAAIGFFVLLFFAAVPLIGIFILLGFITLDLYAMYQAYSGISWKIPVIGDLTNIISGGANLGKIVSEAAQKAAEATAKVTQEKPNEPPQEQQKTPPEQQPK